MVLALSRLARLNLAANAIVSCGALEAAAALPALVDLDLSSNRISALPGGFWRHAGAGLTRLCVSRNRLTALPPAPRAAPLRCRQLDISGNHLQVGVGPAWGGKGAGAALGSGPRV